MIFNQVEKPVCECVCVCAMTSIILIGRLIITQTLMNSEFYFYLHVFCVVTLSVL